MPSDACADLALRLKGLNLYLVGMMGAGKSAVGKPLARALGYRFLDADATLEQTTGRSIPAIFAEAGEEEFRAIGGGHWGGGGDTARELGVLAAGGGDLAGCP